MPTNQEGLITYRALTEKFKDVINEWETEKSFDLDQPTRFSKALSANNRLGKSDVATAQRKAIYDLTYTGDHPFGSEAIAKAFLNSEHGEALANYHQNVLGHPDLRTMAIRFGYNIPNHVMESTEDRITEAAAPGTENWVKANKQRFIDQYGNKKGTKILYATSWKIHESKLDEMVMDRIKHPEIGNIEWRNEGGAHMIVSKNKETGSDNIHYIGNHADTAKKWATVKQKLVNEDAQWVAQDGIAQLEESVVETYKDY